MTCNIAAATTLFLDSSALASLTYSGADQSFVATQIANTYIDNASSDDIAAVGATLSSYGYPDAGEIIATLYSDFTNACAMTEAPAPEL